MKCGFYETEITPPLGSTLYGYFTGRVSEGVKHKLFAKACVIENEDNVCAMLVLDALRVPKAYQEYIRRYVNEKTGIAPNSILIAATHSHTGIPVCESDMEVCKVAQTWAEGPVLNYELDEMIFEMTKLLAADTIIHAFRRLREAKVCFGMGEVKDISYVRQYYLTDGTIHTNPRIHKDKIVRPYAEPDRSLPVFWFTDENDNAIGSIASFALHHDVISGSETSSDYSGVVAQKLKGKYGSDFISLFFSGFCGNINHANYMGEKKGEPFVKNVEEIGEILYNEVLKTIEKAESVSSDLRVETETVKIKKRQICDGFVESSKELMKNPPPYITPSIEDPYSDAMKFMSSASIVSYYGEEKDKMFDVPVQVVKIGDCLIYALPGEMFSQFADKIRKASPTEKNMFIECANHTDNPYIPTKEMFLPFVYEASYYSARLEPDAGDIMTDKAIEIAMNIM